MSLCIIFLPQYKLESDNFMTTVKTKRIRATFGHPPKSLNPSTNEFLKKHSRVKIHRKNSCFSCDNKNLKHII